MFDSFRAKLEETGADVGDLEGWEEVVVLWADEDVHVTLDVSSSVAAKWDALSCHHTQFGADNLFRRMPRDMAWELIGSESFAVAWPELSAGTRLAGLFDGL